MSNIFEPLHAEAEPGVTLINENNSSDRRQYIGVLLCPERRQVEDMYGRLNDFDPYAVAFQDTATVRGRTASGVQWLREPTDAERQDVWVCGTGLPVGVPFVDIGPDGTVTLVRYRNEHAVQADTFIRANLSGAFQGKVMTGRVSMRARLDDGLLRAPFLEECPDCTHVPHDATPEQWSYILGLPKVKTATFNTPKESISPPARACYRLERGHHSRPGKWDPVGEFVAGSPWRDGRLVDDETMLEEVRGYRLAWPDFIARVVSPNGEVLSETGGCLTPASFSKRVDLREFDINSPCDSIRELVAGAVFRRHPDAGVTPAPFDTKKVAVRLPAVLWQFLRRCPEDVLRVNFGSHTLAVLTNKPWDNAFGHTILGWDEQDGLVSFWSDPEYKPEADCYMYRTVDTLPSFLNPVTPSPV